MSTFTLPAQPQAPEREVTLADVAHAQAGKGTRTYVLAPGYDWDDVRSSAGVKIGVVGLTLARGDSIACTFRPLGGRVGEIGIDALQQCRPLAQLFADAFLAQGWTPPAIDIDAPAGEQPDADEQRLRQFVADAGEQPAVEQPA